MNREQAFKAVKAFTTLEGASVKSVTATTSEKWFKVELVGVCGKLETFFISPTHGVRTWSYAKVLGLPR